MTPKTTITVLPLLLALALPAWAHRLNAFAWTEGADVVAEARFSDGTPARQSAVTVADLKTGNTLAEGRTDGKGVFRFPLPEAPNGLIIAVDGGEGHRARWDLTPEDLAPAGKAAEAAAGPAAAPAAQGVSVVCSGSGTPGVTAAEVEKIVNQALDIQLSPLRRALAESAEEGASLKDIVGGIGWLVGIFGIAAWWRRRKQL